MERAKEICPTTTLGKVTKGALVVDVRENNEVSQLAFNVPRIMHIPYSEFEERFGDLKMKRFDDLALESERKNLFAKQLLKSGTSIGANAHAAQNAESKDNFIHKLLTSSKEADQTSHWLELSLRSNSYPNPKGLGEKLTSIIRALFNIISPGISKNLNLSINSFSNRQIIKSFHLQII